jgi:hypothetical protein
LFSIGDYIRVGLKIDLPHIINLTILIKLNKNYNYFLASIRI